MNSGRPVWHASVALIHSDLVITQRWGKGTKREARRMADLFLSGVGTGESVELWSPVCLHVRRGLSDAEMGMLTPAWLAIPARDEFAPECGTEMRL